MSNVADAIFVQKMIIMSICSLSQSVHINRFTAHSKLHLNLQINKHAPFA